MNSDMAIVNLDRGLPAWSRPVPCGLSAVPQQMQQNMRRPAPGGLDAVPQEKHHHLTAHLHQNLRSVSTVQWLQAGDYLFRRGDAVDAAYQIMQGTVSLSCGLPACEAAPSLSLGAGEYLVDSGVVYSHNAILHGKGGAVVLRIPLNAFRAVLLTDGSFATMFAMQMAERAQRLHRRFERLNLKSAEERLCHYLMTESDGRGGGQVTLNGTYGALAGELSIAHATLSRLLKSMAVQGRIQRDGRTLRLI